MRRSHDAIVSSVTRNLSAVCETDQPWAAFNWRICIRWIGSYKGRRRAGSLAQRASFISSSWVRRASSVRSRSISASWRWRDDLLAARPQAVVIAMDATERALITAERTIPVQRRGRGG